MIRTKICGIMRRDDALRAANLGAWAIGFIFYKRSPRFLGPYKAKKIIDALPPFVTPVGVFVNQKEGAVKDIAEFCGLRVLQFHGDESPSYCRRFMKYKLIKAFRVQDHIDVSRLKEFDTHAYLFDTYDKDSFGGTGKTFPWKLLRGAKSLGKPLILSGGVNAENVLDAIDEVSPYAVDVSSGIEEAPGKKSERAMRTFFAKISI